MANTDAGSATDLRSKAGSAQNCNDLSLVDAPISNLFPVVINKQDMERFMLSKEQLADYKRDGFLKNIQVLTESQCDKMLEALEILKDPNHPSFPLWHEFHANETGDPNHVLFHALGAWRISELFHDIIRHPAVTVAASQCFGVDDGSNECQKVRFWHDQLFCKPPKHGAIVAWHQDYSYWTRTAPMAHLTVHIALEDQTLENGSLHYVPGSHNWPLLPVTSRHFDNMDSIMTVLDEDQKKQFKTVPTLLKKGQASIHHPKLVHGSWGNKSDKQRRATVVNLFKDGVTSVTDDVLLEGVPVFKKGKKLEGQFFPLVFDPARVA